MFAPTPPDIAKDASSELLHMTGNSRLRPARVVALARRDLAMELRGRRGWALPFIAALLLVPVATLPVGGAARPEGTTPRAVRVQGDVPAAVREAEADAACTPNPGCMMQIGAGLRLDGACSDVVHPVEILDESYQRAGYYQ